MSDGKDPNDTSDLPPPAPVPPPWPDTGSARVQVELAAVTDRGLVRSANEDHYLILRAGRWLETVQTSLPAGHVPARSDEVAFGLLVADGMGGAAGGETASRTA